MVNRRRNYYLRHPLKLCANWPVLRKLSLQTKIIFLAFLWWNLELHNSINLNKDKFVKGKKFAFKWKINFIWYIIFKVETYRNYFMFLTLNIPSLKCFLTASWRTFLAYNDRCYGCRIYMHQRQIYKCPSEVILCNFFIHQLKSRFCILWFRKNNEIHLLWCKKILDALKDAFEVETIYNKFHPKL